MATAPSRLSANPNRYDPFAPEVIADPYPFYARLLAEEAVYRDERNDLWVLSRHEDVQAALRDHRALSSAEGVGYQRMGVPMMLTVGEANDVLVIPARIAWDDYHNVHAYVCQPERPFQPVKRISFYSAGQIQPLVPSILKTYESVVFERGRHTGRLRKVVERLLDEGSRQEGSSQKILLLSPPDDPETLKLSSPTVNNLKSESGRTIAFTQNQRYVPLARLKVAKKTSELVG